MSMLIGTINLSGKALDWAVAKAEGFDLVKYEGNRIKQYRPGSVPARSYTPSTNWEQGGTIVDRLHGLQFKNWLESKPETKCQVELHNYEGDWIAFGPTILIAAMRCYVASKLGATIEVPNEFI